ncbi:hypothetical protein ABK040_015540 [Willaertia magna]
MSRLGRKRSNKRVKLFIDNDCFAMEKINDLVCKALHLGADIVDQMKDSSHVITTSTVFIQTNYRYCYFVTPNYVDDSFKRDEWQDERDYKLEKETSSISESKNKRKKQAQEETTELTALPLKKRKNLTSPSSNDDIEKKNKKKERKNNKIENKLSSCFRFSDEEKTALMNYVKENDKENYGKITVSSSVFREFSKLRGGQRKAYGYKKKYLSLIQKMDIVEEKEVTSYRSNELVVPVVEEKEVVNEQAETREKETAEIASEENEVCDLTESEVEVLSPEMKDLKESLSQRQIFSFLCEIFKLPTNTQLLSMLD